MKDFLPGIFFLCLPLAFSAAVLSVPLGLGDKYPADWTRDTMTVVYRYATDTTTCCKAYFGAISRLGFMVWSAAAAMALLTAVVHFLNGNRKDGSIFMVAVVLTALLVLDDALMLHERGGILSAGLYSSYAVLVAVFLVALLYSDLRLRDAFLFGAALAFLAASFLSDNFLNQADYMVLFIEDVLKFCGISLWMTFFLVRGARELAAAR